MSYSCGIWPGIECQSCERFSANEENLRLVGTSYNRKNDGIADTLLKKASGEDEEGNTAFLCSQAQEWVYNVLLPVAISDIAASRQSSKGFGSALDLRNVGNEGVKQLAFCAVLQVGFMCWLVQLNFVFF